MCMCVVYELGLSAGKEAYVTAVKTYAEEVASAQI